MWYYPCGHPVLINFFKPILFLASDSSSGFRQGISYFFTATKKYNRMGEEEQTNNMDLSQLQAQESFVTILYSFSSICRLSRACILRETSTKNYLECQLIFNCLPSFPPFSSTGPCLLSDLPFLLHLRSRQRSRVQALCLGFASKQRLSAWRTTLIVSHA